MMMVTKLIFTQHATGQYIAACIQDGYIYTNDDYGYGIWTPTAITIAGKENWNDIISDAVGKYLYAVVEGRVLCIHIVRCDEELW